MRIFISIVALILFCESAFAQKIIVSPQELIKHNTVEDCWIVVNENVYDITNIVVDHKEECEKHDLSKYCGADASELWAKAKDKHKRKSNMKLERSLIGKFKK